jgi:hypothetical protein
MASLAFLLPILPGKEETDIQMLERFTSGDDKEAFGQWHRSHGVRRHAVWHQKTPDGTVAIVLLEADDIEAALRGTATSDEPFDQQFRDFVKDVHGVDLANDPPADVVPVIDWRA